MVFVRTMQISICDVSFPEYQPGVGAHDARL